LPAARFAGARRQARCYGSEGEWIKSFEIDAMTVGAEEASLLRGRLEVLCARKIDSLPRSAADQALAVGSSGLGETTDDRPARWESGRWNLRFATCHVSTAAAGAAKRGAGAGDEAG
jgi:hypothetical protein